MNLFPTRAVVWLYILSPRVPLVEQKLLTLTENLNSLTPCYGSRVAHFLVFFCVMFCRLCLSFVGHCVVGLSIYSFWLPHCYGHTFLGWSPREMSWDSPFAWIIRILYDFTYMVFRTSGIMHLQYQIWQT